MADHISREEKTEQPTSRRRTEARNKGQVAKSVEVNSTVVLLASFLYFIIAGAGAHEDFRRLFVYLVRELNHLDFTPDTFMPLVKIVLGHMTRLLLPFLIYIFVVGVVVNLAQVGWLWTTETLRFRMLHFNIINSLRKIFWSKDTVVKLLFSIVKVALICWVVYSTVWPRVPEFVQLTDTSSLVASSLFALDITAQAMFRICLLLALIAVVDYFYQRHKHEEDLKMTKEEVKEELKNMDIDPQIKAKIRARQMAMSRQRMMSAIPDATVVITNPTHLAIAIKYDLETMDSPVVVAKGARLIAKRIREIAAEHGIPIVENKELARDLYKHVEINAPIPMRLYKAVAKVLAYVYNLKKGTGR